MVSPYKNKDYLLIQPSEIGETKIPEFGVHGRPKEEQYRKLLEDSQIYFQKYLEKPANESFYLNEDCDAATVFLDFANAVTVRKQKDGKYYVTSNGYHRMYIAKKYNLPLLVCCDSQNKINTTG